MIIQDRDQTDYSGTEIRLRHRGVWSSAGSEWRHRGQTEVRIEAQWSSAGSEWRHRAQRGQNGGTELSGVRMEAQSSAGSESRHRAQRGQNGGTARTWLAFSGSPISVQLASAVQDQSFHSRANKKLNPQA